MNKQEALEALLRKVRGWEDRYEEVKAREDDYVYRELRHALDALGSMPGINHQTPGAREYLTTIGAAALYMLIDEVTVVEGRTLDEWLAAKEPGSYAHQVAQTMALRRDSAEHSITFGPDQISPSALEVLSGGAFTVTGRHPEAERKPTRAPYLPIPISKDGKDPDAAQ